MANNKKYQIKKTLNITSYEVKQALAKNPSISYRVEDFKDKFDTVVIVNVSDWHIGTLDFDLNEAIKVLNYVLNTPNALLFVMGDTLNSAILNAVSNMYEDIAYPQEQWQLLVDLFSQVSKQNKLSVLHTGNHEERIFKQTGSDIVSQGSIAMNSEDSHAPYYAIRDIVLKCADCPDNSFVIPVVSHHGDGIKSVAEIKKLQDQNNFAFIDIVGHRHILEVSIRNESYVDEISKKMVKKAVTAISMPSAGGGYYGDRKNYEPNLKSAYLAIEVTVVKNPRYEYYKDSPINELEYIPVLRSIPIMDMEDTDEKAKQIRLANNIIKNKQKEIKAQWLNKTNELLKWIKEQGATIQKEVYAGLTNYIKNHTKLDSKSSRYLLSGKTSDIVTKEEE